MLQDKSDPIFVKKFAELEQFLKEVFLLPAGATEDQYPSLPLLMSLLDMALDRRQSFHKQWDLNRLVQARQAVELGIFDLLESKLSKVPTNSHYKVLQTFYPSPSEPCIISLNYDLIIDTAMMFYSQQQDPEGRFPNYCCDIRTEFYRDDTRRFGTLLKLHGSLNWLYCKTCSRLEIGASETRPYIKILNRLLGSDAKSTLEVSYKLQGSPCLSCQSELRPLLIAPSHLKDCRNPHLIQVWYETERVLRECNRAIFIGYSMPDDDLEVVYLFKRGLAHLAPEQITVIEYDMGLPALRKHAVGRRFGVLFGDVDWHPEGIDTWLNAQP